MSGARVFPVTLPGVWEALASLGPGSSGRRLPLNSVLCSAALYAPPECGTWIRARGTFFSRFGDPACSGSIVFNELIFSAHPLPPPFAPVPARTAPAPAPQAARSWTLLNACPSHGAQRRSRSHRPGRPPGNTPMLHAAPSDQGPRERPATRSCEEICRPADEARRAAPRQRGMRESSCGRPGLLARVYHTFSHVSSA